jgi:hypothetical protein
VSAKRKRFIILCFGNTDADSLGYDEETLPLLWKLVDSCKPAARLFNHMGAVAYYLASLRTIAVVEGLITKAELLRDTDSRFATLGIGLAEGWLIAEFDWLGRVKSDRFMPLGDAVNDAARPAREPQRYKERLRELKESLRT